MNAERVREVMEGALARDTDEIPRFLDESCGPDAELRADVESLLAARKRMGRYLEMPAAAALARDAELAPGQRVGGYEILGVIGRGGSGVVYRARQKSPDRVVALKTLRLRLGGDEARFLDETQTLARFRHPAIAHIYEAGVHEGVPFFSMEFVEGPGTIVDYALAHGLDARARLELLARVADGVHYGHQRGVIHCDLKPGNILVGDDGAPRIVDFGIARTGVMNEGDTELRGTLRYMSPEQCQGGAEPVDVRSDVYALGVVLYELLTGRLPIDVSSGSITQARRRILGEAPVRIESVAPRFRGDVAAIVHKALEKDRERRYASAAALADDLRRHLTDRVVEAAPAGVWVQVRKFARRQRLAFLSFATLGVVLAAAAAVSSWLAVEYRDQRTAAQYEAYLANVAAAAAALEGGDVGEATLRLDHAREAFRGWEWHHLRSRLDTSVATVEWPGVGIGGGALSADGRTLVAAAGALRAWELAAERVLFTVPREPGRRADVVALSPDGQRIVTGYGSGRVDVRSARTGEVLAVAGRHEKQVSMVSFHPDGTRFASAAYDGTVRISDAATGALLATIRAHPGVLLAVRYDRTGTRIATGGDDGRARVFAADSGEPLALLSGHESHVEDVAFSPDGKRLVSASMDQTLRLWDIASSTMLAVRPAHKSGVKGVAWSPDGRTIASCSIDSTVRLWNADDLSAIATYRGHRARVYQVEYATDGARIASFSGDGTVRLWDVARSDDVPWLKSRGGRVGALAFSSDGELVALAAANGSIELWSASSGALVRTLAGGAPASAVRFLDGSRRVVAILPRKVASWTVENGAAEPQRAVSVDLHGALIAADGRIVAWHEGDVLELDAATGAVLSRWNAHSEPVRAAALHEGRGWLVTVSLSGEVRLWHRSGGDPVAMVSVPDARAPTLAFHPDGELVVVGFANGTATLLSVPGLATKATFVTGSQLQVVEFSPDGSRLAACSGDGTFQLWDPSTARQAVALRGHRYAVSAVAWSPDGRSIATAENFTDIVRFWRSEPAR
ncbi:MAG: protein kinase domain-containing protein [Planctomycetaceae bacterium]